MPLLPSFDAPLLLDEPPAARLTEVLLREAPPTPPPVSAVPGHAVSPAAPPPAAADADPAPLRTGPPLAGTGSAPDTAAALPPDSAFPTRAELDAILAALTAPPPPPPVEDRAAMAGALGLDPAIAADPALFDATLAALPEPDAGAVLAQWLSDAGAVPPAPGPAPDWPLG